MIRAMTRWADDPTRVFLTDDQRRELATWMIKSLVLNEKLREEARKQGAERRIKGGVLLSWGSEHIHCGIAYALMSLNSPFEFFPVHRSHISYRMLGVDEYTMFLQMCGKAAGPTAGKDGYMDFPVRRLHIQPFRSEMAASMPVCVGMALGSEFDRQATSSDKRVIHVVLIGDGAMNQGVVGPSLNQMVLDNLPVLVVCENNGIGLSVLAHREYVSPLTIRAAGYGMSAPLPVTDGMVESVFYTASNCFRRILAGEGSFFTEIMSVRTGGHNDNENVSWTSLAAKIGYKESLREAEADDPVEKYLGYLKRMKPRGDQPVITDAFIERTCVEYRAHLDCEFDRAASQPDPEPTREALGRVFVSVPEIPEPNPNQFVSRTLNYRDALNEAYRYALASDPRTLVFGQDVAEKGGVQGVTKKLMKDFGPRRVFDSVLDESLIVGMMVGLASKGFKPIAEAEFAKFILCGMGQLAHKAGISKYFDDVPLQATLRLPQGAMIASNDSHEGCVETLFMHLYGFKIACPATAYDAKGLFIGAFRDPNFVIVCDWIPAYDIVDNVPEEPYEIPLGKADIKRVGSDVTIITYGGLMVPASLSAAEMLHQEGIEVEVVDLRSFFGQEDMPFDIPLCFASAQKTGKILVVHEAQIFCGIGAEVMASLHVAGFTGAMRRLASVHTPVPFADTLKKFRTPSVIEIADSARALVRSNAPRDPMLEKYVSETQTTLRSMRHDTLSRYIRETQDALLAVRQRKEK